MELKILRHSSMISVKWMCEGWCLDKGYGQQKSMGHGQKKSMGYRHFWLKFLGPTDILGHG